MTISSMTKMTLNSINYRLLFNKTMMLVIISFQPNYLKAWLVLKQKFSELQYSKNRNVLSWKNIPNSLWILNELEPQVLGETTLWIINSSLKTQPMTRWLPKDSPYNFECWEAFYHNIDFQTIKQLSFFLFFHHFLFRGFKN